MGSRARTRCRRRSRAARSIGRRPMAAAALAGAEVAFVAAPVGALPAAVRAALDAAGDDCVVTDVGSTKRAVVEATRTRASSAATRSPARRPGVQHARADLFQGATWYLTPTARSRGTLYERLHRLLPSSARAPAAIDAATHDRLLATVSHLPHVLANVLVAQAAQALGEESVPATGPSFRDVTRVAGSNTAIWRDIYLANADALIAAIDDATARLAASAPTSPAPTATPSRAGTTPPATTAAACSRPTRRRRGPRAARLGPEPARRRRRGRARARPQRRQHLRHGPPPRPPTARRATSSCGSPAPSARPRPRRWSRARPAGRPRMNQTFRPGPGARHARPAARQVALPPGRDARRDEQRAPCG